MKSLMLVRHDMNYRTRHGMNSGIHHGMSCCSPYDQAPLAYIRGLDLVIQRSRFMTCESWCVVIDGASRLLLSVG